MADAITIKLEGAKRLEKMLIKLGKKVGGKIVRQALRAAAKPIQAAAKAKVPVDTGRLKKSIRVRAGKRTRKSGGTIIVTTSGTSNMFEGDSFYGGMVEYGTSKLAAQPFMRPAFDENKGKAADIFSKKIKQGIVEVLAGR